MTDKQLEYIVTIANHGGITSAAGELFVSQSSLSQLLSHVEKEVGVQIFDRASTPLKPTYAGELFLTSARKVLEIKRNLSYQYRDMEKSKAGRLNIGIARNRSWLIMPFVLPEYMKQYPNVKISFFEDDQEVLDELLLQGKIDVMFTIHPYKSDEINYQFLYKEYMYLILSKEGYPAIEKFPEVDLLRNIPFVLPKEGHDLRRIIDNIFCDFKIVPNIVLESHSMDVCFQLAAHNLGATIIPDTLYRNHKYKDCANAYRIGEAYGRDVAIAYRKEMYLFFILQEFIRIASEKIKEIYLIK